MKPTGLIALALAGCATADFMFYTCSGTEEVNPVNHPGFTGDCGYVIGKGDQDPCSVNNGISASNKGGSCNGNLKLGASFCGETLDGSNCPSSFQMGKRNDSSIEGTC